MPERAATETAAHQLPAGLGHQQQEAAAVTAAAGHHHLRTGTGLGGNGQQLVVAGLTHHAEAIHGGQIRAADADGVAVGIDVAVADAGEVEGGQQRIHHAGVATLHGVAGASGVALLVDVELSPGTVTDRGRHQHELGLIQLRGAEQRLGPQRRRGGQTQARQGQQRGQDPDRMGHRTGHRMDHSGKAQRGDRRSAGPLRQPLRPAC